MPLQDKVLDIKLSALEAANAKISEVTSKVVIRSAGQSSAERLTGGSSGVFKTAKLKAEKDLLDQISAQASNSMRYCTSTCNTKVAKDIRSYFSKKNYIVIQLLNQKTTQNYVAWYGKSYCMKKYGSINKLGIMGLFREVFSDMMLAFDVDTKDRQLRRLQDQSMLIVKFGNTPEYTLDNGADVIRNYNELMRIKDIDDEKKRQVALNKLKNTKNFDASMAMIKAFMKLYDQFEKHIISTK